MKRHKSRNSPRDEKPSRNEDSDAILRARTEEERRRRRRDWMIEQEKMDRHNRLKRKMAMEYEIQRARNMGLALPEGRCNRPRRSRSESPPSLCRRIYAHHTPKDTVLSEKFETSSGTMPLFKGSEGTKIIPIELRKIKVDIHRNIPGRVATSELERDIPNKEDVVIKRRAGEGSKPIFDREEIKRAIGETQEVEEHRSVATVNLENSKNKLKRNSASLSPTRTRNRSPRRTWSRHPRCDDSKHEDKGSYRSDREKDHSRERKDSERSYRDHRERPRDHSRDSRQTDRSRERDRLREQRVTREHYIQPIHIYYGNFQPRPLMVQPWGPIREPLGGNIHPPMMRPLRTFPLQSIGIPPDMYGFRPPLNPMRKNVTRNYALPAVTKLDTAEDTIFPPILDLSRRAVIKRQKEEWHNKIKKLETVEEKLYGINMPRYYGWKSLDLIEGHIPYNSLPQARYITRTHVVNDHKLPDFYNNLITPEELDIKIQNVKKQIEDAIIFEYCSRLREQGLTEETEHNEALRNDITNAVTYQINRILLTSLSSTVPHLMEAEIDFEPRVEAFWFAGGIDPPHIVKQSKEGQEFMKEYVNDPVDMPVQYSGSPILQLRHRFPLKEIIPTHESENPEFDIPVYKFDPRVLGYKFSYKHATSIPGFWPGDPSEFGLLSYHNANHLYQRPKIYKDELQALTAQAIFASYSWLLSQACYQGFSTVNDVTYPLVSQTVITNGQWWTFCAYQLNTTLLHSEYADENPVRNMCWITEPMKLFDTVENEKIHGFNEDVLKSLMKFYVNMPEERMGVEMKPYLGKSVKRIADIPDVERRTWLEGHFKNLASNRPRHFKIPETSMWQKFYLIDHKTRPMDKKRDPWQFGYRPMRRRLDDHLPIYIPRCLRENPKKRKVGRWAKTYYPDA